MNEHKERFGPGTRQLSAFALGFGSLLLVAWLAFDRQPAHATFPGDDGAILLNQGKPNDQALYTVQPDGSGLRWLRTRHCNRGSGTVTLDHSYAANGSKIVAVKELCELDSGSKAIVTMRASNAAHVKKVVSADARSRLLDPVFSPSGKRIAYVHQRGQATHLNVIRKDGTDRRTVVTVDGDNAIILSSLDWSPDGKWIVYAVRDHGVNAIERVNPAKPSSRKRIVVSGKDVKGQLDQPGFGPKGIRFTFHVSQQGEGRVMTARVDGSRIQSVSGTKDAAPQRALYSPTGRHIAFTRLVSPASGAPGYQVCKVSKAGGSRRCITDPKDEMIAESWRAR